MTVPFFIEIALEPFRKRLARKRHEKAERERRAAEAEKARLQRIKDMYKNGCGHRHDKQLCASCYMHYRQRGQVSYIDGITLGYY